MPFEDGKVNSKKGLKLNNSKSSIPTPKGSNAAEFEEAATKVFENFEGYKSRMHELAPRFKAMIEDKVLQQNKSPIVKDLENEVFNKLLILAKEMNADENQPEGEGSVVLSGLLLKMVLSQRDIINNLAYKIEQIEKNAVLQTKKE